MSAYFDTGFCVRTPSWHGQENLLADWPIDWNDARLKAGLLWEPESRPAYQLNAAAAICADCNAKLNDPHADSCPTRLLIEEGDSILVTPNDVAVESLRSSIIEVPDQKLIVRNDTEAVLGVVGQGYELVTHAEMGGIIEAILDVDHVKFETAGSVKGGAAVWALAYLDEPYTTVGDSTETYPFLALLNSHDGSGACKVQRTQIRVVCWNTYNAADMEGNRHGLQYSFRHTSGVHDRIEEAKAALAGLRDDAKEWDELSRELFGMKADDEAYLHFVADFIPEPPADVVSPRVRANIDRARAMFKTLYLDSPTTEAHRGTALGLLDAAVEYSDHLRGYRNRDTYLGRTLLRPEPLKAKALTLVRQACK